MAGILVILGKRSRKGGAVAIRIIVDLNRCQAYGQCGFAAPAVFQLHGETLVYDPMPSNDLRADVERAVLACPVQAIRVQYNDEADG